MSHEFEFDSTHVQFDMVIYASISLLSLGRVEPKSLSNVVPRLLAVVFMGLFKI